ncbi:MAG: glycogen/starch/alpha-glucan phosphorylase, partial [Clostridia bacterium]|nr:glycogen/starch/alpha-glucan phosphorylase [Clostridia bacterium]
LSMILQSYIGSDFMQEASCLQQLEKHIDDDILLDKLIQIKNNNKLALKNYVKSVSGFELNENSIFDIQIKRLHEYKRQQLNALYIIYKYLQIKDGILPTTPVTFIFGAKAAPSYVMAKDIIHMLLCLAEIVNNDSEVNKYINVFFAENYNVTYAEKLIPACDISEQISLASKEASGTGNMKFMLNGAVTLGTEDGANVEIHGLVGDDNIYIFGSSSDEVINHYKNGDYNPRNIYDNSPAVKKCVDFITGEQMTACGDAECLERVKNELIKKDWFMTLLDFEDYIAVKDKALDDYDNRHLWARKILMNISRAGYFSSDRTIREYNEQIWNL